MRFVFDPATGFFDLALTPSGGLDSGVGNGGILASAIWTSLFSDGLADAADLTPDLGADRRGWWADSGRPIEDSLARSQLWLYRRARKDDRTKLAIQTAAEEAVQWLVDDGVVSKIDVSVDWLADPLEGIGVCVRSSEPPNVVRDWKVDLVWAGIAG